MDFNNNFHNITKLVCKTDESTQKLCTACMITLSFVATVDEEIEPGEISFLKYYLHNNFNVSKAFVDHAVHDYLLVHRNEKDEGIKLSEVRTYLKENLLEDQKKSFLTALLKLSASDNNIEAIEKKYVKNIALGIGLDDIEINQELLTQELVILQQIDSEIAADDDLNKNQKIEFASVHEMIEDLKEQTKS